MIRPVLAALLGTAALAAAFMTLAADQLALAWALAGLAGSLLVLVGLMALAWGLPPLPALVLTEELEASETMARARAGDELARQRLLDTIETALHDLGDPQGFSLGHRREELLRLLPDDFDRFLESTLKLAERRT